MKIITKQDVLRGVPERWRQQYPVSRDEIYQKLLAVIDSGNYSESQIDAIIGNDSWTSLACYECDQEAELIIHLGEEPNYESKTFFLCASCLTKAIALVGAA
jgi:hypothetical protein